MIIIPTLQIRKTKVQNAKVSVWDQITELTIQLHGIVWQAVWVKLLRRSLGGGARCFSTQVFPAGYQDPAKSGFLLEMHLPLQWLGRIWPFSELPLMPLASQPVSLPLPQDLHYFLTHPHTEVTQHSAGSIRVLLAFLGNLTRHPPGPGPGWPRGQASLIVFEKERGKKFLVIIWLSLHHLEKK